MNQLFYYFSVIGLILVLVCAVYLWGIAVAGMRLVNKPVDHPPYKRFAIAIPAHNEESVIGETVSTLQRMDYPVNQFDIFVVADYCSDHTSEVARAKGGICFDRKEGERGGKGSALLWLFERIFSTSKDYDAVVIFDADTKADPGFLRAMNFRLNQGDQVIQGRHVISNPHAGLFPALTWAMMAVDNRYSNQGRSNLNLSAKHMGDSICFRSDVLRKLGWGKGLTEDYDFRVRLLLDGIHIKYEPWAIGWGQAPLTWKDAQAQRLRWAKGISDTRKNYLRKLLREGIKQKNIAMLDAALSMFLPSYSTLALLSLFVFISHLLIIKHALPVLAGGWGLMTVLWFVYPLFGLMLERAEWWAYLAIFSGPLFMLWRSWIVLQTRLTNKAVVWVRTPHRAKEGG